ncbi:MAG: hypothetical protein AAF805_10835, partial [Planctomycetota bacterium]
MPTPPEATGVTPQASLFEADEPARRVDAAQEVESAAGDQPGDDDTTLEDAADWAHGTSGQASGAGQAPSVAIPPWMRLELDVRDPAILEALAALPVGRARNDFALDAMRIGVAA